MKKQEQNDPVTLVHLMGCSSVKNLYLSLFFLVIVQAQEFESGFLRSQNKNGMPLILIKSVCNLSLYEKMLEHCHGSENNSEVLPTAWS